MIKLSQLRPYHPISIIDQAGSINVLHERFEDVCFREIDKIKRQFVKRTQTPRYLGEKAFLVFKDRPNMKLLPLVERGSTFL